MISESSTIAPRTIPQQASLADVGNLMAAIFEAQATSFEQESKKTKERLQEVPRSLLKPVLTAPNPINANRHHVIREVETMFKNQQNLGDALEHGEGFSLPTNTRGEVDFPAILEQMHASRLEFLDKQTNLSKMNVEQCFKIKDAKFEERQQKLQEQTKMMTNAKKGSVVSRVFGWISSVVMAVVGAAMVATGVGALAGGCLLASSCLSLTQQISGETGNWLNKGASALFSFLEKKDAELAGSISLSIIIAGLGLAGGFAGAAKSTAGLAQATSKSAETAHAGIEALKATSGSIDEGLRIMTTAGQYVGGASLAGQGVADICVGYMHRVAGKKQADSVEIRGAIEKLSGHVNDGYDSIRAFLDVYAEVTDTISTMLKDFKDTNSNIIRPIRG